MFYFWNAGQHSFDLNKMRWNCCLEVIAIQHKRPSDTPHINILKSIRISLNIKDLSWINNHLNIDLQLSNCNQLSGGQM